MVRYPVYGPEDDIDGFGEYVEPAIDL